MTFAKEARAIHEFLRTKRLWKLSVQPLRISSDDARRHSSISRRVIFATDHSTRVLTFEAEPTFKTLVLSMATQFDVEHIQETIEDYFRYVTSRTISLRSWLITHE